VKRVVPGDPRAVADRAHLHRVGGGLEQAGLDHVLRDQRRGEHRRFRPRAVGRVAGHARALDGDHLGGRAGGERGCGEAGEQQGSESVRL
jgi:hypothetical protein